MSNNKSPEGLVIENTYRVDNFIAGGAFGQLHFGLNIQTKQLVAIKLESKDSDSPQLPLEYRFYVLLGSQAGIPEVYHFGPCGLYHALVMELLGPSLENVFVLCNNKLSLRTTARIAKQLISIIEYIHNKKLIYRDIKPENFLLGRIGTQKANIVHVIDFGLAKEYIDPESGFHIPMKSGKALIGTPRYMSSWSHLGKEQSRRDDLESIGFMLIYFIKGRLPWQGLKGQNKQRYSNIGKMKRETTIEVLCSHIHEAFAKYMRNVRRLQFETKPNYSALKTFFNSIEIDVNEKFDWEEKRDTPPDSEKSSQFSIQTVGARTI